MALTPGNSRTFRTLTSYLRNKASTELNRINDPIVRSGLGSVINAIDPGLLGGTQFGDSNVFRNQFQARANDLVAELEQISAPSRNITPDTDSSNITLDTDKLSKKYDWRARLRPKNGGQERFYAAGKGDDYLMKPIVGSGGLVWQHTPTIYISGSANYHSHLGQGQQYKINTYQDSQVNELSITATFTANNIYEARYMLAMMAFLKIATKADFGEVALVKELAGAPPPVLIFEYLGDYGFNKVPVVVQNYSITFSNDVDYVPVETNIADKDGVAGVTYVPTVADVTVLLMTQYTPRKVRTKYDVAGIANGSSYKDGFI